MIVDEGLELERPRNPTPTAASSSTADIGDVVDTGAIPKKGPKYDRKRERTRHVSAGKTRTKWSQHRCLISLLPLEQISLYYFPCGL